MVDMRIAADRSAQLAISTIPARTRMYVRSKNPVRPYDDWAEVWAGARATASLSQNGYQILPSGLIIQWLYGEAQGANGDDGTLFTLPIAFPNAALTIVATDVGWLGRSVGVSNVGKTQCRAWTRSATTGAYANASLRIVTIGH